MAGYLGDVRGTREHAELVVFSPATVAHAHLVELTEMATLLLHRFLRIREQLLEAFILVPCEALLLVKSRVAHAIMPRLRARVVHTQLLQRLIQSLMVVQFVLVVVLHSPLVATMLRHGYLFVLALVGDRDE